MKLPVPTALAAVLVVGASAIAQDVATDVDKAAKTTTHEAATVVKGSVHGTKKAATTTARTTAHAVKKTGQGVKKGVKEVGHEAKKASNTTSEPPR